MLAALIRAYPNHAVRIVHDASVYNDEDNGMAKLVSRTNKSKTKQVEKSSSNDKTGHKHHSHHGQTNSNANNSVNDSNSDDYDDDDNN